MTSKYLAIFAMILTGCTTGHISYIDKQGNMQRGCETEYRWAPSVDKHAVNYILHYCAQKAQEKGYEVIEQDILALSTEITPHPEGLPWTYEEATTHYRAGQLTAQEYGYIIAHIDLSGSDE